MQEKTTIYNWNWFRIGTWGAVLIIVYFLITEHQAHVIQFLPYVLLLACPFMHFFMHKDHHRHNHANHAQNKETE